MRAKGSWLMLALLACDGPDATSTTVDTDDENWPAPEDCETRQIEANGDIEGPTDLQAVCEGGWFIALHRPSSETCTTEPAPIMACEFPGGECQFDADCESLVAGGKCAALNGLGNLCHCVLQCTSDADCPSDRACVCRSSVSMGDNLYEVVSHTGCWPATCRSDAECGVAGQCAMATNSCGPRSLACRGPDAVCQSDLDCGDGNDCTPAVDGSSWSCVDNSSCQ